MTSKILKICRIPPKYGVISNEDWKERIQNANPHLPDNIRTLLVLKGGLSNV
jgi:hypothetical protein